MPGGPVRVGILLTLLSILPVSAAEPDPVELLKQADALMAAGRYDEALPLADQALVALRALDERADHTAVAWNTAGLVLRSLGRYDDAREHFERSLEIRQEQGDPVPLARALGNLGLTLGDLGKYEEARPLLERALEIRKAELGMADLHTAESLSNLGQVFKATGDLATARSMYEQALAVYDRSEAEDPRSHGIAHNNMAGLHSSLGEYDRARHHYERAVALLSTALGDDHPTASIVATNYVVALHETGDLIEARRVAERAGHSLEASLGPEHPWVGVSLQVRAFLHQSTGDFDEARRVYDRALPLLEAAFGWDHPLVSRVLNNVALMQLGRGELEAATATWQRALSQGGAVLGQANPTVLLWRVNLASVLHARLDHQAARALLQAALDDIDANELGAAGHRGTALNGLGAVEEDLGELEAAEALYREAHAWWIAHGGTQHPDLTGIKLNLARVAGARGAAEEQAALIGEALAIERRVVHAILGASSERERFATLADRRGAFHAALDLPAGTASGSWEQVLYWKGAARRAARGDRDVLAETTDPELRELTQELVEVRRTLSGAVLAGEEGLDELTRRKESLESSLALRSGEFARAQAVVSTPPEAICGGLEEGSVLVDLVRRGAATLPGRAWASTEDDRYTAFVVSPSCAVQRVELGPAAPVDEAIASWRRALAELGGFDARVDARGKRVRELLWDPIAAVTDAARVWVAPDGPTSLAPLGALPLDDDTYLIEQRTIGYLGGATDLARRPPPLGGEVLLVGGLEYGPPQEEGAARSSCVRDPFPPLPDTSAEIAGIAHLLRRHRVEVIQGSGGDERAVEEAAKGRSVLHLATHGFFAQGACRSALSTREAAAVGFNPLVLSGLALAGANDPATERGDGLWTAEEVASLDLSGAGLVVLSACETGLGTIAQGEGVLGLRWAFDLAGAGGLVMSLWSVPDADTRELMLDLYGAMFHKRRPRGPVDALRDAQLAALERNRRTGQARPGSWAAFIASGPQGKPVRPR